MKNENGRNSVSPVIYDGYADHGLTKREYFAGLAMQGIISRSDAGIRFTATEAVRFADALLRELDSKQ